MPDGASRAWGRDVTYDERLALAEQWDPVAARVVAEAGHALGTATAAVAIRHHFP